MSTEIIHLNYNTKGTVSVAVRPSVQFPAIILDSSLLRNHGQGAVEIPGVELDDVLQGKADAELFERVAAVAGQGGAEARHDGHVVVGVEGLEGDVEVVDGVLEAVVAGLEDGVFGDALEFGDGGDDGAAAHGLDFLGQLESGLDGVG